MTGVQTCALPILNFSARQVFEVYESKIDPTRYASIQKNIHNIVWELRLPRAILSICVGGGLALCGAVMQALTRNVMAEPYTLGVASGASFMAALSISLMGNIAGISGVILLFLWP